jgi:hypothetical protein
MDKFYNNSKQLGFTLEMIFRGADTDGKHYVKQDYFKITLK